MSRCGREAVVVVRFATGGTFPYCWWHSTRRDGEPRWRPQHVEEIRQTG